MGIIFKITTLLVLFAATFVIFRSFSSSKRIIALLTMFSSLLIIRMDAVPSYSADDIEYMKYEMKLQDISKQPNVTVENRDTPIDTIVPVKVNDGVPFLELEPHNDNVLYHNSEELDPLGRTRESNALIGSYSLPNEKIDYRGLLYISPSGWNQERYSNISRGGWLYKKTHLIPYALTGNSYLENIITGTNYLDRTLDRYADVILYYIEKYDSPVRVRVTAVYEESNVLPSGVYIEAYSVEDSGESIMINSYIPNRQPGIEIDYEDGSSEGPILEIEKEPIEIKHEKYGERA